MDIGYIVFDSVLSLLYYVLALTAFSRLWDRIKADRLNAHVEFRRVQDRTAFSAARWSSTASSRQHAHASHEGDSPLVTPRASNGTAGSQQAQISPRRRDGGNAVHLADHPTPLPFTWLNPLTINYVTLLLYGAARGTVLCVSATNSMPEAGSLRWLCVEAIPVFFLMTFSAAFVNRWVSTIELMSVHLYGQSFSFGVVIVRVIVSVAVLFIPLACIALYDISSNNHPWLPDPTWVKVVALYIGGVYTCNGLCFSCVGLYLARSSSALIPDSLRHIRIRLTATACLFGAMCTLRGVGVFLFFAAETSPQIHQSMNTWGLDTMLTVEWATIATLLFFVRSAPTQMPRMTFLSDPFVSLPTADSGY